MAWLARVTSGTAPRAEYNEGSENRDLTYAIGHPICPRPPLPTDTETSPHGNVEQVFLHLLTNQRNGAFTLAKPRLAWKKVDSHDDAVHHWLRGH